MDLVDDDLRMGSGPLANRQKSLLRRHCDKVDLLRVLRSRNKALRLKVQVHKNNIVTCEVDEFLLIVEVECVVDLAIDTKCDPWRHRYARHAHVAHLHHFNPLTDSECVCVFEANLLFVNFKFE